MTCLLALLLSLPQDVEAIDRYLNELGAEKFSGSVLVARKGEVVLQKAYGWAEREKKTPNRTTTLFDIGSVSKHFTAAAIYHLESRGKLKLDDPVTKFFEGVPDDKKAITLRHLIQHSSGIPHDTRYEDLDWTDRDAVVKAVLAEAPRSRPGEKFVYNNRAYLVLAAVVERASGTSFEAYLKEHLFRPAGLRHTSFCREADVDADACAGVYHEGRLLGAAVEAFYAWGHRGATGILSSVEDLWRWELALRGETVLPKEARARYFEPSPHGYAGGWFVRKNERGTLVFHTGSTIGFYSGYYRWIDADVVFIYLLNMEEMPWDVMGKVEALLFQPAKKDDAAEKLFRAMEQAVAKAKTLRVLCKARMEAPNCAGDKHDALLQIGDAGRVLVDFDFEQNGKPVRWSVVSDGKATAVVRNKKSEARRDAPAGPAAEWWARGGVLGLAELSSAVEANRAPNPVRISGLRLGKKEALGKRTAQIVDYTVEIPGMRGTHAATLWIDTATNLPLRRVTTIEGFTFTETYEDLKLDPKLDAKIFRVPE